MHEKNRTHAKMVLSLATGITKSLYVAEVTGNLGELKPMIERAKVQLTTCDYRDEEDFREARLKAGDIMDVLTCEGFTSWAQGETRDLISDLNTIYQGFVK